MNKAGFIKELQSRTDFTEEQCTVINSVLEDHFIFHKKNKPIVVADIAEKLSIDETQSDEVYEISMSIIRAEKKKTLRRPLGSRE